MIYNKEIKDISKAERWGAILKAKSIKELSYMLGGDMLSMEEKERFLKTVREVNCDDRILQDWMIEENARMAYEGEMSTARRDGRIEGMIEGIKEGKTPPPLPPSGRHSADFIKGWTDAIKDVVDKKVNPTDPNLKPKNTGNEEYDDGYNAAIDNMKKGIEDGIDISDSGGGGKKGSQSDLPQIPWDIDNQSVDDGEGYRYT